MLRFFPSPFGWPDRTAGANRPPIADFSTGPHDGSTPPWRDAVKKPPQVRRRRAARSDPLFDIAPPVDAFRPRSRRQSKSFIHPMLRALDRDAARHMDHPLMGDLLSRDLPNPAPPYAPPNPASLTAETDPFLKLLQDRRAARASVRGRMLAWRAPGLGPAATPEGAPDPFADRPRFDRRAALTEAAKAAARAARARPDGSAPDLTGAGAPGLETTDPIEEAPAAVGADRIDWTHFDRSARAFAAEDLARERDAFDAAWRQALRRPQIIPISSDDPRARNDIGRDPSPRPKEERDAWVAARAAELKRRRTLIQELLDAEAEDDAREIDARAKGLRRRAETELSDIDWAEVENAERDESESESLAPADGNAPTATPPPALAPATLANATQEEADSLGLSDPTPEADPVQIAQNEDGVENDADPESGNAESDQESDEGADDLTGARGRKARRDARYPKRAAAQAYADAVLRLQTIEADLTRIQNRTGQEWEQRHAELQTQKAALEAQRDANFPQTDEERAQATSALGADGVTQVGTNTAGILGLGKLIKPLIRSGVGRIAPANPGTPSTLPKAPTPQLPTPKPGSAGGPTAGKRFSETVKKQEASRTGNRCVYCGVETTTSKTPHPDRQHTDHAIPRSKGGNATPENANNACQTCNLQKGSKTMQEFDAQRRNQQSGGGRVK